MKASKKSPSGTASSANEADTGQEVARVQKWPETSGSLPKTGTIDRITFRRDVMLKGSVVHPLETADVTRTTTV